MSDRPRLLIVDDDRAITSTVGPMLRELADVDTAHTVAEALEKLASHTYGAVVLDVVLGDDASSLHDALSSREVPVALVSGRDPLALERIASTRGWEFAAKPISPDVLRALVARLLSLDAPEPTQRGRMTPAPRPGGPQKALDVAPQSGDHQTPHARTLQAPTAVQVLDRLGEIIGIICLTVVCLAGRLDGMALLFGVAGILGVQTGIRTAGSRGAAAATSVGAVGLVILHAGPALEHLALLVGRARGLAVLALTVTLGVFVACGPVRAAFMAATPGVPPLSRGVDAGTQRCNGAVPEACVTSGDGVRCWPSLQRDARGRQRACLAGCAVDDAGFAVCLPEVDASTDAAEVLQ